LTDAGHELLAKKLIPFIQTKLNHPKEPLPGPPPNPNLPGDWQTMDIGQEDMIGLPGTVSADSSTTFTLWGSGADIDNDKDGFRFVYQPFSNQGKMETTIRSHSTFAKCAKAGIMIREHLGHGSPFIMLGISPADGIFLQIRYDNFQTTHIVKKLRASPPYRLRLIRHDVFVAQIQALDDAWETFATVPFDVAHDVYAGLAVTSCDTSVVSVAKFTEVQLYHNVAQLVNQQM
jgi:regulation of enolase protein 1 (concanavalin A-like superfamily)